ncbi:hypothetical protein [Streptomyces sp. NPDC005141]
MSGGDAVLRVERGQAGEDELAALAAVVFAFAAARARAAAKAAGQADGPADGSADGSAGGPADGSADGWAGLWAGGAGAASCWWRRPGDFAAPGGWC